MMMRSAALNKHCKTQHRSIILLPASPDVSSSARFFSNQKKKKNPRLYEIYFLHIKKCITLETDKQVDYNKRIVLTRV